MMIDTAAHARGVAGWQQFAPEAIEPTRLLRRFDDPGQVSTVRDMPVIWLNLDLMNGHGTGEAANIQVSEILKKTKRTQLPKWQSCFS